MHVVNNINYPAISFATLFNPFDHPAFKGIWTKLKEEQTVKALAENPALILKSQHYGYLPEARALIQKPTAKRVDSWPFCAVGPKDFEALGYEGFRNLTELIGNIWTLPVEDNPAEVEIIKPSAWDDAFNTDDGFTDWLKSIENNFIRKGTILRPAEGIVEKYVIIYSGESHVEGSAVFSGRYCLWAHMGYYGFRSKEINLPQEIRNIASYRKCTPEEAFFQEDMYNILKYLHYKEHFSLHLRKVRKYETVSERANYPGFRVVTDTPCCIIDETNRS